MSKRGRGGRMVNRGSRPVDKIVHKTGGRRKGEKKRISMDLVKR